MHSLQKYELDEKYDRLEDGMYEIQQGESEVQVIEQMLMER